MEFPQEGHSVPLYAAPPAQEPPAFGSALVFRPEEEPVPPPALGARPAVFAAALGDDAPGKRKGFVEGQNVHVSPPPSLPKRPRDNLRDRLFFVPHPTPLRDKLFGLCPASCPACPAETGQGYWRIPTVFGERVPQLPRRVSRLFGLVPLSRVYRGGTAGQIRIAPNKKKKMSPEKYETPRVSVPLSCREREGKGVPREIRDRQRITLSLPARPAFSSSGQPYSW